MLQRDAHVLFAFSVLDVNVNAKLMEMCCVREDGHESVQVNERESMCAEK